MRTRVKQPLKFKNVFLRGALALLLAIACVPAEAIASGSQAWGSTWGYAAIYQKDGDDGYALVLQSSPSADTSYGRLVQCEPATDSGLLVGDIEMQHAITEVIVRDTLRPSGLPHAFAYLDQCTSMDLSKLDTSSVTDMSNMFERCSSLTSLDLGSFDTSSVTDMSFMFDRCQSLTSLDLGSFDTSSVTDMISMFEWCQSLTSLDLGSFDTSSVTDMRSMFSRCSLLETIYATGKYTTALEESCGDNAFSGCLSLRGGNGTKYSDSHTDASYARIDAPGQPGYFSDKASSPAPQPPTSSTNPGGGTAQPPTAPSNSGGSAAAAPSAPAKAAPVSLAKAQVTVKSKAYTGKTLKPTSVTVKVGGKKLVSGRDYTVSCKGGKAVGSYKVTVKGKGAYTGTKTAAFKILPKATSVSKTKAAKRGFTVAWKKPSKANLKQTTGYKVQWSTDKKFKKAVKSKLVKKNKTTSLKVSKLKGGKKYYVRVCAYKKVGGKYYYSAWSKAKAVKTKK